MDEFYQMARAGIFTEHDRVELIEGEIVEITPIGSRHGACVDRTAYLFFQKLGGKAIVRVQGVVRLGKHSESQPDIALLKHREDFYSETQPGPHDLLLIVEMADTSQEYDRGIKVPLYARHGIPEVWVIDLQSETVRTYRTPAGENYQEIRRFGRGETISCFFLPELQLAVDEVLG